MSTPEPTTDQGAAAPIPIGPEWLPRGFTVLVTLASAMIVVAGMRAFSSSIGPIFLALVIVVVVSPVQRALLRRGAPSWLALLALLISSFGVLAAVVLALVWSSVQLVGLLSSDRYADQLADARDEVSVLLDELGLTGDSLDEALEVLDLGAVAGQITSALSGLLGLTSAISLLVITMLFMVLDTERFRDNLNRVRRERPEVDRALGQFASQTRSYFVVSTVFGLIVAALDVVALMMLGIPLALVWGVLSLITNYIPNIGFVIGLIPPALLAFFEGGWQLSVWVIVVYLVINTIIQSVIQPRFVGDAVGLSTTLTFLSLIFWGWALGPIGALLAVPITLLTKALLVDIDPTTRWAAPLISLSPTSPIDVVAAEMAKVAPTIPADDDTGNEASGSQSGNQGAAPEPAG
ncbi:MAG: AI-2E family transporter [Actinomycetota bacterium]